MKLRSLIDGMEEKGARGVILQAKKIFPIDHCGKQSIRKGLHFEFLFSLHRHIAFLRSHSRFDNIHLIFDKCYRRCITYYSCYS